MALFKPKKSETRGRSQAERSRNISLAAHERFGPDLLGLGDLAQPAVSTDAIAMVFDLEGFTIFSKQIEPHLCVPVFLKAFLHWLMSEIKSQLKESEDDSFVRLWAALPFFAKFMGDGLLLLWDASPMSEKARLNIIVLGLRIQKAYASDFLPSLSSKIVDPPPALRCGVARGTVLSVGDGKDFVGSCINMAARLQKMPGITFAANRRGFDVELAVGNGGLNKMIVRKVEIRGIGGNELVLIRHREFEKLTPNDKSFYRPAGNS